MAWLGWVVVLVVILPLLTLLHELGHALPALVHGAQDVTIVLGSSDPERGMVRRRVGRLNLALASWLPLNIGCVRVADPLPFRQRVQVILGGPLTSLLVAAVLVPLAYATRGGPELLRILVQGAAAGAFLGFALTIIPIDYPRWFYGYAGKPSDMRRLIRLARSQQAG